MPEFESEKPVNQAAKSETTYEAPAIESLISPEEMEREVHYAGSQGPSSQIPVCST